MSVFKDFPGLEIWKNYSRTFKDPHEPCISQLSAINQLLVVDNNSQHPYQQTTISQAIKYTPLLSSKRVMQHQALKQLEYKMSFQ